MDFQHHMDFARPSSTLSVDRKPSAFSYDDNVTLDSTILDTPSIMSPTGSHQGMFSPETSLWEDFPASGPFVDRQQHASTSSNPFFEQNNNPFTRLPPTQAATYGQQPSAWPLSDNSGTRTPTTAKPLHVFGQSDYDAGPPSAFIPVGSHMPSTFGGMPLQSNVQPSAVFSAGAETPLSPHSNNEWMALAQQELEARPGPKRMRANSPPRSFSPRRDGIRKKNARFDIPPERSLHNIDLLIQNSTNDDEIKELKQQKRLLRNRQAALDSRQRKKKHTEELEEEKKLWTERISCLDDEVTSLRLQMEGMLREKEQAHHEQLEMRNIIDQLQWDKEELVRAHTVETGDLRKKVNVLTERLESTSTAMSVAPSSTFTDFATDMDNLNMGANDWSYIIEDDYYMGESTPSVPQNQQQEHSLVVAPRKKDAEDKPVASGLLLMLLLCGAFVASKSSGSSAPPLPRMPDDVRAASATVLDSIFKDAGVAPSPSQHHSLIVNRIEALEPAQSGVNWNKRTLSGAEFASLSHGAGSHLDQLHAHLAVPTKDQENEQLFGITPSQYNSLTSTEFTRRGYSVHSDDISDPLSPGSQPSHHRRNLAETLAAMREDNKGETAAEVYTRSLLWERIPSEVVHEFKRMVEESDRVATTSDDGIRKVDVGT